LSNLIDTNIISAFISGTTNETLVHKMGQKSMWTIKELLDIATSHTSREDAVGSIFNRCKRKAKHDKESDEDVSGQLNASRKGNQRRQADMPVAGAG
jgi:hypothetical protein